MTTHLVQYRLQGNTVSISEIGTKATPLLLVQILYEGHAKSRHFRLHHWMSQTTVGEREVYHFGSRSAKPSLQIDFLL